MNRWRAWLRLAALWIVHLYPPSWRQRYEEEMRALVEECGVTVRTITDLLTGAVDAHRTGADRRSSTNHVRDAELVIVVAVTVFLAAWVPLQQVRDPLSAWQQATAAHPVIQVVFDLQQVSGALAGLLLVVSTIALTVPGVDDAIRSRNWSQLRLWSVSPFAISLFAGYCVLARSGWGTTQSSQRNAPLTLSALALQLGFLLLGALSLISILVSWTVAVRRSPASQRIVRFTLIPVKAGTVCIGLGLVSSVALIGLLRALTLSLISLPALWPIILMIVGCMALALAVSVLALRDVWHGPEQDEIERA